MSMAYNEMQLDALRELSNIASGNAATSLSQMLGREVHLEVPLTAAVPLEQAVDVVGDAGEMVTGVVLGVSGGLEGLVVLLMKKNSAEILCRLLGVEAETDVGRSALGEIGNILGTSYLTAISSMTSLPLIPSTPTVMIDLLGAIVSTTLAVTIADSNEVILVDSDMTLVDEVCEITFMLLPQEGEISTLLEPLGLAEAAG